MKADRAAHDFVVIGSGCTGGTAAWQLTRRGKRVLMLEAGDPVPASEGRQDPGLRATLGRLSRVLISRRQRIQSLHPSYWVYPPQLFIDDKAHPYSTPEGRPFVWIRGRQVGGRSLTWAGLALRLSPYELGSWPIDYEQLAPYYDEVEQLMGICGNDDHLPQLPDGRLRPGKMLTPAESAFRDRVASQWPDRRTVVARGVDQTTRSGWSLKTSLGSTLEAASATGLLDVRPRAVARRLVVDEHTGRVRAVEVVDPVTHAVTLIPARSVVLCASTIESVRLLFNSASAAHPKGLGNSSGLLGRYLMNKVSRSLIFHMPIEDAAGGTHPLSAAESFVIPRYQNLGTRDPALEGGFGVWGAIQRLPLPRHLAEPNPRAAFGILVGYGECLPYADNRIELDSRVVDGAGMPTVRVDVRWRDNETRMADRINGDLHAMVAAAGGAVVSGRSSSGPLSALRSYFVDRITAAGAIPGTYVHEVGGARMGVSPDDSVVNTNCQLWDSDNVFVTDGACWPASGWQNPTLTMMAITARSCDFAAGAF